MKKLLKKPVVYKSLILFVGLNILLLVFNFIFMPWFVKSPEIKVPNVVGQTQYLAIEALMTANLSPVIGDTVYNNRNEIGTIVLQKPRAGDVVKERRRIYLVISGGEQSAGVPMLLGKSIIDARFALERVGLRLGQINESFSDNPKDIVIDQQYPSGIPLKRGKSISITISLGSEEGNIEVPDLVGRSYSEAEKVLRGLLLNVGKVNYQPSFSLLPNTVIDQYPSKGNKLNDGGKVDLFVTKNVDSNFEISE